LSWGLFLLLSFICGASGIIFGNIFDGKPDSICIPFFNLKKCVDTPSVLVNNPGTSSALSIPLPADTNVFLPIIGICPCVVAWNTTFWLSIILNFVLANDFWACVTLLAVGNLSTPLKTFGLTIFSDGTNVANFEPIFVAPRVNSFAPPVNNGINPSVFTPMSILVPNGSVWNLCCVSANAFSPENISLTPCSPLPALV